MEYIFFDEKTLELHYRDSITSSINRTTFEVVFFNIDKDSGVYQFDTKQHDKLKIKKIFFPIDNTVLILI